MSPAIRKRPSATSVYATLGQANYNGCKQGFATTNPNAVPEPGSSTADWSNTDLDPRGDARNGMLRADSFWELDAGLNKKFALPWEHSTLEFRAQYYNVLNKDQLHRAGHDVLLHVVRTHYQHIRTGAHRAVPGAALVLASASVRRIGQGSALQYMAQGLAASGASPDNAIELTDGLPMKEMEMLLKRSIVALVMLACAFYARAGQAPKPHVLMISIDGMKPEYVTHADEHGLRFPRCAAFLPKALMPKASRA